ncbi:MAG TPA: TIGR03118 family protein [Opitutaceae bacterium]|nr:TIGR03118 family protein [Opitutaceae bacterium]
MQRTLKLRSLRSPVLAALFGAAGLTPAFAANNAFKQSNLVSDIPGLATYTDPNLVNPWGLAASGTSPMWVSNADSGTSTIYNGAGLPLPLVVTVPAPGGGAGAPTGQIFNGTSAFHGDRFIFATENGTVAGWRGALGTAAETLFDMSGGGANYKGLAFGTVGADSYLYAADFHNARIDIFNNAGATTLAGAFVDPNLPVGYAPFNVQNLGGSLFVTYALQDAGGDEEVAAPGAGFVSRFDLSGNLLGRFASDGVLNAPWGMAIAPVGFGGFGGNLLVGNFGDGRINAFDLATGDFIDVLRDASGHPFEIEGLWGIQFGNGAGSGPMDTLYFAAGIEDEAHGLYGAIAPVPEPATYGFAAMGLLGLLVVLRRFRT